SYGNSGDFGFSIRENIVYRNYPRGEIGLLRMKKSGLIPARQAPSGLSPSFAGAGPAFAGNFFIL
ncbi:MAG: hypothetical protein IKL01_06360, partial [Mailhella sp.]|nr:hypothetical protein [Mailhella sp.]